MAFGTPDFTRIIDAYEAGSRRAERSRMQEMAERGRVLTGQALNGDAAAEKELAGVNPEAYINVKNFNRQQKAQELDDIANALVGADTPEKYAQVIQTFRARGHQFDPAEEQFSGRQGLLNQAMGWKERLAQEDRDRNYNFQKLNADRTFAAGRADAAQEQANSDRLYQLQRDTLALKDPDLVELYDEKSGQPYKARWNAQTKTYDRVGGVKAPNGTSLEVGPDGTVSFQQGMGKPLTEGQSKDTAYLTRMAEAVPLIDQMGDKLTSFGENVGGRMPLVGNYLKSPEYQAAEQAAGVWRQAFLRKDSGAQISESERADTNQLYIPQPGDKAPVLLQKAKARRTATLAVKLGLPYKAVMEMQKAGVDVDKIIGAPLPGAQGGKTDQQPRIRTYNPATGELE